MLNIYTRLLTLKNDTKGVTAVEYGILVGIMAAILIAAVGFFGNGMEAAFTAICTTLSSTATCS